VNYGGPTNHVERAPSRACPIVGSFGDKTDGRVCTQRPIGSHGPSSRDARKRIIAFFHKHLIGTRG
jgi:hypothetical protein